MGGISSDGLFGILISSKYMSHTVRKRLLCLHQVSTSLIGVGSHPIRLQKVLGLVCRRWRTPISLWTNT